MIGRKFTTTAVIAQKDDDTQYFNHFGIYGPHASMWGHNAEEVIDVELEAIQTGCDNAVWKHDGPSYWGMYYPEEDELRFVYPSWAQFYIVFPYGPHAVEESGDGIAVNLKVELK